MNRFFVLLVYELDLPPEVFRITPKSGIVYLIDQTPLSQLELGGFHFQISWNQSISEHYSGGSVEPVFNVSVRTFIILIYLQLQFNSVLY